MASTVAPSLLTEVRLTSFKSYRNETLPLDDLTLVVERNGSGKSNALDALWVLARLASGEDIRDALDAGREGPSVRGGALGCAPFGEQVFTLGCSVATESRIVTLDVTVQVEPVLQIVHERLAIGDYGLLVTDASCILVLPLSQRHVRIARVGALRSTLESHYPSDAHHYGILLQDTAEVSPYLLAWVMYTVLSHQYGVAEDFIPNLYGLRSGILSPCF